MIHDGTTRSFYLLEGRSLGQRQVPDKVPRLWFEKSRHLFRDRQGFGFSQYDIKKPRGLFDAQNKETERQNQERNSAQESLFILKKHYS